MKRTALTALLLSSAFTVSAFAASDVRFTGDLGLTFGANRGDDSGNPELGDASPLILNGHGSLFVPFSNTKLSATVDLFAENAWSALEDYGASPSETDYFNYGGGVHFTYAQPGRYRLGVVGALWQSEVLDSYVGDPAEDFSYWLFGVEGKFMLERAAIFGQAGYFTPFNSDYLDVGPFEQVSFFRGGINYYLEDDLKIGGEIALYNGSHYDDYYEESLTLYRVELEQQVGSMWSVYGAYQFANFNGDYEAYQLQQNAFTLGFRVRFGDNSNGTLRSQEETNSIGLPNTNYFQSVVDSVY